MSSTTEPSLSSTNKNGGRVFNQKAGTVMDDITEYFVDIAF